MTGNPAVLSVGDLSVEHLSGGRRTPLLTRVTFSLASGSTLGIVGESGSGKSITAQAIMGLLPPGLEESGSIRLDGTDITRLAPSARRKLNGRRIAMIFQDPMTALNPVYKIGDQIAEALRAHDMAPRGRLRQEAVDLLKRVRIPDAERRVDAYPHQLSGGMRQRVVIAIALACKPSILIADEPTTALDVTVQRQILALFRDLREEMGMATILVSHDLGVIAESVDHVLVLYAGRVVEQAPVAKLFADPQHPYTIGLLSALPRLGTRRRYLTTIPGQVPAPGSIVEGCPFANRCPFAVDMCRTTVPELQAVSRDHYSACLRAPLTKNALEVA